MTRTGTNQGWRNLALLSVALGALVSGCGTTATSPATGRTFSTPISEQQEASLGRAEHPKILEEFGGEVACAKRFAEQLRSGDSILNSDVDTDAAYRGHGVGGVSDAEQAGKGPALKVVDLNG